MSVHCIKMSSSAVSVNMGVGEHLLNKLSKGPLLYHQV